MSIAEPRGFVHVNLDGAYENDLNRCQKHFHEMFFSVAQNQLRGRGIDLGPPLNVKPSILVAPHETQAVQAKFQIHPRPWIFVCPRSDTYIPRQVPDWIWQGAAAKINGTCFWLGRHPAPPGFIDLRCQQLDNLIWYLSAADLLVSVDTGPAHIGIALGIQTLMLGQSSSPNLHFSDQRDFETIWPKGDLKCLNCQSNICRIDRYIPPCHNFDPPKIAMAVNRKLRRDTVSALIPTFKADPNHLSKAIDNVIGQVDEVVLTVAADGIIPNGIQTHPKLRIVRCPKSDIGFGKNVNYGFRHTAGNWVLLLNDDCYLNENAVKLLKEQRWSGVGMIAHLLRYPNGQIYFAGRQRPPGFRGFPHIDHMAWHPSITQVTEMEALSCTSVLINRQAFYKIGGFDERFHMYAEDDDFSVRIREAGYKLLYEPAALGVHEGSATVKKLGKQTEWIQASARLMEQKWGAYWDWNKSNSFGNFGYK
jgi:GT2 family glycosyltransferase